MSYKEYQIVTKQRAAATMAPGRLAMTATKIDRVLSKKCATSSTVPTGLDSLDWIFESWYNSEPTIFIYETQGWRFHLRSIPNGWRFIVGLSGNWSLRVSHYITSYCLYLLQSFEGFEAALLYTACQAYVPQTRICSTFVTLLILNKSSAGISMIFCKRHGNAKVEHLN